MTQPTQPLNEQPSALADELAAEMRRWENPPSLTLSCDTICRILTALKTPDPQVAVLREALKPFAEITFCGTMWSEERHAKEPVVFIHSTGKRLTVADFERARTALNETRHD